jgi:hypothetical protein
VLLGVVREFVDAQIADRSRISFPVGNSVYFVRVVMSLGHICLGRRLLVHSQELS